MTFPVPFAVVPAGGFLGILKQGEFTVQLKSFSPPQTVCDHPDILVYQMSGVLLGSMSARNKVAGRITNIWGERVAARPVAETAKKLIQPHRIDGKRLHTIAWA